MIKLTPKKDCCGCGACMQICPRQCISMSADSEGFLYPVVNPVTCVNCGLCRQACPILNPFPAENGVLSAYAAYANEDNIRMRSSSGGIFSLLARKILEDGGVVFGAGYSEDFSVRHEMISCQENLSRLQGSKYVQSRIEDTYQQAKEFLELGKTVLFSGVGCQIAGLKTFLGKDYSQLYTVDILCHGVPSPMLWERYLQEHQAIGGKIKGVCFRDKHFSWQEYSMHIQFQDQADYHKRHWEDPYFSCFLENISLRPSCHNCRFKCLPHSSDLTLGDAWGISAYMPDMNDGRGTSLVLVNTEKGAQLCSSIASEMVFRTGDTDRLLPLCADSRTSVPPHPRRTPFFSALSKGASMEQLVKIIRGNLITKGLSFGKRTVAKLFSRE